MKILSALAAALGVAQEGFMPAVLAVMETPAILTAIPEIISIWVSSKLDRSCCSSGFSISSSF